MRNKSSLEGYFLSDNRMSGGSLIEAPILTCSHCQKQMLVNPMRTRDRAYCPKCDHYICDECEVTRVKTGICRPFVKIIDTIQDQTAKGNNIGNPQLLIAR